MARASCFTTKARSKTSPSNGRWRRRSNIPRRSIIPSWRPCRRACSAATITASSPSPTRPTANTSNSASINSSANRTSIFSRANSPRNTGAMTSPSWNAARRWRSRRKLFRPAATRKSIITSSRRPCATRPARSPACRGCSGTSPKKSASKNASAAPPPSWPAAARNCASKIPSWRKTSAPRAKSRSPCCRSSIPSSRPTRRWNRAH